MKQRLRITLLGTAMIAVAAVGMRQQQTQYVPRTTEELSAQGAAAYLHSLRANQITGEVSQEAILDAMKSLENMPENALGLSWAERGPDDVGGRSRAIAFNPNNPSEVYLGSVSGGMYFSNNGGLSWIEVNPEQENLAVNCVTYTKDGDVYYGTGEGLFNTWTTGYGASTSSGFPGAGVFKKAANETQFTQVAGTENFASIGRIVADPNNNDRVLMSTSSGLRITNDGGQTWTNPFSGTIGSNGTSWDVDLASDGTIWTTLAGRIYKSTDDGATFTEVSKTSAGSTDLPRSGSRVAIAVAKNDPNYVYVVQITTGNALGGVYRSTDGGDTWTQIGQKSTYFDPFCVSQCQGVYDLALGIDPSNKNRIIVGGIDVWQWEQGIGWDQVDGFGPFYVHADQHDVVWHPTDSNKVFIVNDGGLFTSRDNGVTWQTLNKGFVTTQFYNMNISQDRYIVGGTQDNGSWVMDGTGNTPNSGRQLGGVDGFRGDGGYSAISWLVPKVYFTEYQQGRIGRSENRGQSFSNPWDARTANETGSWMTPFYLYENSNDPLSTDSVWFSVGQATRSLGFASVGQDSFSSVIVPMQEEAIMLASTFTISSGTFLVTSDANGNLSGDGTGTFNASTGEFTVEFNGTPAAEIVARVDLSYNAGANITVGSNTNGLPFNYTLPAAMSMGDSLQIQDPVSSMFIVGFVGSVWMTRDILDFSQTPEWYKLASINGTVQSLEVSADGDHIWVGTENGRVYRISGVQGARSLATGDIELGSPVTTVTQVANYSGRNVTNIAVDPNDNDRVLVTLGNYSNSNYIYYSANATDASPSFVSKDGNLGNFPVYAATFDKGNSSNAIIGTEFGIFSTDNINAAQPNWGMDNSGLARVPVFTLKQYRTNKSSTADNSIQEGDIFAGTYGRGIFQTTSLASTRPLGIGERGEEEVAKETVAVYPNPAEYFTTLEMSLPAGEYTVELIDMNGRVVKSTAVKATEAGTQRFRVDVSSVRNGMYIIGVVGQPKSFTRVMVAH